MSLDVTFLEKRKGSNPGGKVSVSLGPGGVFDAYLKYCQAPPKLPGSSFGAPRQPLYEAATYELARLFGLHTPNCFVLLNADKTVNFKDWKKVGETTDPASRPFYFVSRWIDSPVDRSDSGDEVARAIVGYETPYLNALHVADVVGRRQNYILCDDPSGNVISYIDLGCSFVQASEGRLKLPTKTKFKTERDLRQVETKLSRLALITADESRILDLSLLPEAVRGLTVATLNPSGRARLSQYLSAGEMGEIERDVMDSVYRHLDEFESKGVLIRK